MPRGSKAAVVLLVAGLVVSGCSGGVDGPVVASDRRSGGEAAEIFGEVAIEGDCLYLDQAETDTRYPVIWPHGTGWEPERSVVVLPDGAEAGEGASVSGAGGYHSADALDEVTTDEGIARVRACVDNEFGEIAVLNSSEEIEVQG